MGLCQWKYHNILFWYMNLNLIRSFSQEPVWNVYQDRQYVYECNTPCATTISVEKQ
jgi:hypothetical protein